MKEKQKGGREGKYSLTSTTKIGKKMEKKLPNMVEEESSQQWRQSSHEAKWRKTSHKRPMKNVVNKLENPLSPILLLSLKISLNIISGNSYFTNLEYFFVIFFLSLNQVAFQIKVNMVMKSVSWFILELVKLKSSRN